MRIDADLLARTLSGPSSPPSAKPGDSAFASRIANALRETDALQKRAEAGAQAVALGEGDLVQTMVSLSKADLALRYVVNVRNRALEAYNEIMRMPV